MSINAGNMAEAAAVLGLVSSIASLVDLPLTFQDPFALYPPWALFEKKGKAMTPKLKAAGLSNTAPARVFGSHTCLLLILE
jgi:hypothetical protein